MNDPHGEHSLYDFSNYPFLKRQGRILGTVRSVTLDHAQNKMILKITFLVNSLCTDVTAKLSIDHEAVRN